MVAPPVPSDLLLPDYGGPTLRAVLPAAARALGVDLPTGPPPVAVEGIGLRPTDKICVVLVDGLGLRMLQERGGHAPYLRAGLAASRPLTTGFPATTATSLTMLGTGLVPGQSGILGYTLRDPATGDLVNMLSWAGSARPEAWQPHATIFERLTAAGIGVVSIGKERFRASGLTRAAFRGGRFVGVGDLADGVDAAVAALRDHTVRLVYLYWGEVDGIGHHKGWGSWEWGEEVGAVDAALAGLARRVPRGTSVVVTADHGMVDVTHRDKVDVARTPALSAGVDVVAGEPRAVHVHTRQAGAVVDRWREYLGESAWVLTREEAEEAGLFGPVAARHRPVIGDVVAMARGHRAVLDSRVQSGPSLGLIGMHGSLTADETLVPLVVQER